MSFFSLIKYLKYKLFARHGGGHGIHSPFLFRLVSEIFRNKTAGEVVFMIEGLRRQMECDTEVIEVKDLGAGSKQLKGSSRRVSDIVRNSAVPRKYGMLLHSLASEFGNPAILELGTSLGISTMYLASGNRTAAVHSVEGCPSTVAVAGRYLSHSGLTNVLVHNGSFREVLADLKKEGLVPGLVFIDGDHRRDSVIEYFSSVVDISSSETVIVVDDIHHSGEMEEAWDTISNDKRVTLSVDIFRMGLLFFRSGMTRAGYVIRY